MQDWQLATVGAEAATAVVVFMGVSLVEVSTGEAFVVTVLAVVFVAAVLVTVITDSIMMSSSSTTSAFRGGGSGAIRTDITVPTITRTTIGTAGTVTEATPAMNTAMAAEKHFRRLRRWWQARADGV